MGNRKQTNVGLAPEAEKLVQEFASLYHQGKFATAAKTLIEDALLRIKTKADYVEALERVSIAEAQRKKGGRKSA